MVYTNRVKMMPCQNHPSPLPPGYAMQPLKFCKNSAVEIRKVQNYMYDLAVSLTDQPPQGK